MIMTVRIVIGFFPKSLPAFLTIRSYSGRLLFSGQVNSSRVFLRVNTCERGLVITVRPISSAYTQKSYYIDVCSAACRTLYFYYSYAPSSGTGVNNFTLIDADYGLPVESATLIFGGEALA